MAMESDLPDDVIQAIHRGRDIEAVKLLREARDLGLKDAYRAVQTYRKAHPDLVPARKTVKITLNHVIMVCVLILLVYGVYNWAS